MSPTPAPLPDDLRVPLEEWRTLMAHRPGMSADDVDELTDHLLAQVHDLRSVGLHPDEAFLIAVKRLGAQDAVSRQYAQVHSDRLWRQLVLTGSSASDRPAPDATAGSPSPVPRIADEGAPTARSAHAFPSDLGLALVLGLAAGLSVRIPYQVLGDAGSGEFYLRNIALLVLPFLVAYFMIRRALPSGDEDGPEGAAASASLVDRLGGATGLGVLVAVLGASAALVNVFPHADGAQTPFLTAVHLPIALLAAVGVAYLGGRWRRLDAWMDWARFLGEAVVYYVLIALCGGLLVAILAAVFGVTDVPAGAIDQVIGWVVPVGAAGAVLVCAWLVERKKSVVENMAPVLTAVFTPLLTAVLLAFLAVAGLTGGPVGMDRDTLVIIDGVLVAVAAIVLFTVSARPSRERRVRTLDWMQLVLVAAAILVDLVMLWAMAGRLLTWGATPNKVAGLGCNLLLLAHLTGSAWQYGRLCAGRASARGLERWQSLALPAFGVWALVVALAFPPAFGWA